MLLIRAAWRCLALAGPWAAIAVISPFAARAAPSGDEVYTKRCSACHDQANPRIPPRDWSFSQTRSECIQLQNRRR
jgi:cytochrome c5